VGVSMVKDISWRRTDARNYTAIRWNWKLFKFYSFNQNYRKIWSRKKLKSRIIERIISHNKSNKIAEEYYTTYKLLIFPFYRKLTEWVE